MKAFKLISFTFLLLMGNVVMAADEAADAAQKDDISSASFASDINDKAPAKTEEPSAPPASTAKEASSSKEAPCANKRALGSLLANKAKKPAVAGDSGSDKRIQELEDLVQQQQKLIEMYKNKK